MSDTAPPVILKRVNLECPATFGGLLSLLAEIPNEVPHEADIVDVTDFYDCRHEHTEETGPHVPDHLLALTLEWRA